MTVRNMRSVMRERIWYDPPAGPSFILDDRPQRSLVFMNGWGSLHNETETTRGPYQNGNTLTAARLLTRTITMLFRYSGRTRDDAWNHRRELIEAVRLTTMDMNNPTYGTLSRLLATGEVFCVDGLFKEGPQFPVNTEQWDGFSFTESMTFVCYSPIIYNPTTKVETLTNFDVSDTQSVTISYPGSYKSLPVIAITGPGDSFTITNTTTGKVISYIEPVETTEIITIDLNENIKTVVSSVSGSDVIDNVPVDDDLGQWAIQPISIFSSDGDNDIDIEIVNGTSDSEATITYYENYVGI